MNTRPPFLLILALLLGCGDDDPAISDGSLIDARTPETDGSPGDDSGLSTDASTNMDAGESDAGPRGIESQLLFPETHTIASVGIPLTFVNTHEDADCGPDALHRNAYPGVPWDHVLGVHGGRFPYFVELLTAPDGISVGQNVQAEGDVFLFDDEYMRLRWPAPVEGSHAVSLRVTDQDGAQVTRSWTLVVSTESWLFIDPTNGDDETGDGSIDSPFLTDFPLHNGSRMDSTHTGKLVYIRDGTLQLVGMDGNYTMGGGPPKQFVGYPGESARIALNDRWFTIRTGGDDASLKNLELFHGTMTTATADRKIIAQLNDVDRNQFVDLAFSHYEYGTSNRANGALISSLGGINQDQFIHNIEVTGDTGTVVQSFKHRNALYQLIRIHDASLNNQDPSSANGAIRLKDGWSDLTIRLCEAWDNNTWPGNNGFINLHGQDQSMLGIGATDICYNRGTSPSDGARSGTLIAWSDGRLDADIENIHVYRNTFAGPAGQNCYVSDVGASQITAQRDESNIFHNGSESTAPSVTNANNLSGGEPFVDGTLHLTGSYRTENLGTIGAELAMPSR